MNGPCAATVRRRIESDEEGLVEPALGGVAPTDTHPCWDVGLIGTRNTVQ